MKEGKRFCIPYRRENLYVVVTPESLDFSMTDVDNQLTHVGLDMIATLVTVLKEKGIDMEEVSGRLWEVSRKDTDLAGHLSRILMEDLE